MREISSIPFKIIKNYGFLMISGGCEQNFETFMRSLWETVFILFIPLCKALRNVMKATWMCSKHIGSLIQYVRKIFRKANTFYLLISRQTWANQWVINVSFSGNFAYVLKEWPLNQVLRGDLTSKVSFWCLYC